MSAGTVLIVDDNPIILRLVADLLASDGFDVAHAGGAEECMRAVEARVPELILMDIQLPVVDGLELTRRLKADPRTRDVPVVALTSGAMAGDRERALAAGCNGYIVKPFDTRTLGRIVAGFIAAFGDGRTTGPSTAPSPSCSRRRTP